MYLSLIQYEHGRNRQSFTHQPSPVKLFATQSSINFIKVQAEKLVSALGIEGRGAGSSLNEE